MINYTVRISVSVRFYCFEADSNTCFEYYFFPTVSSISFSTLSDINKYKRNITILAFSFVIIFLLFNLH